MIWKKTLYVLIGYAALCVLVFVFQRRFLYFPLGGQLSQEMAGAEGLRYWPSYEGFRGFTSLVEPADAKGTLIVFHGNAGAAYHRTYYEWALSNQNMRVILAEYPGFGGRDGGASERALVEDALETIRLAHQMYGEPLYLWGESLGAGVVSGALRKTGIPIKGVVLFTPWDTLPDLAQTHYPYLPARWLVLDKYDNIENLQGYEGNVAVLLAGNDEVVPLQHGQRLYDAITANKRLWSFEGATHNTMPVEAEQPWWQEVIAFISQ
jgi:alpha-beta hydrolase superfamily lysophospholipase